MVKVVITAPKGAMDSMIVEEAWKNPELEITGCVGNPAKDYIGKDIGDIVSGIPEKTGIFIYRNIEEIIDACDVVLDFSTVELSMEVLECCKAHGKALFCGTTGFTEEQTAEIIAASDTIPLIKAANTSYVVNVMKKLLGEAAAMLADKCRIEIIDLHPQTKLDAPSGTALELGEEIAENAPDKTIDDITFHSVRAGNTPSSHRILFGCMGEIMTISHDAYDMRCFASGACHAAVFLGKQAPGNYTMVDVIES